MPRWSTSGGDTPGIFASGKAGRSAKAPPQAGHQSASWLTARTAWQWVQIRSMSQDYSKGMGSDHSKSHARAARRSGGRLDLARDPVGPAVDFGPVANVGHRYLCQGEPRQASGKAEGKRQGLRIPSPPEDVDVGRTEPVVTAQLFDGLMPRRLEVAGIGPGRSEDKAPRLQDFESGPLTGKETVKLFWKPAHVQRSAEDDGGHSRNRVHLADGSDFDGQS